MKLKIRNGSIFCIVMKENKLVHFEFVKKKDDSFKVDNHVYFINNNGTYIDSKRNFVCCIYLEGISLPISHKYVEYEYVTKTFLNEFTGKTEKHKMKQIKNLQFDSKAIGIILNQKLAEIFTKIPLDMPNFLLALLLVGCLVTGIINIGMWFL